MDRVIEPVLDSMSKLSVEVVFFTLLLIAAVPNVFVVPALASMRKYR